jgi:uncharacterized membrane protein YgcG
MAEVTMAAVSISTPVTVVVTVVVDALRMMAVIMLPVRLAVVAVMVTVVVVAMPVAVAAVITGTVAEVIATAIIVQDDRDMATVSLRRGRDTKQQSGGYHQGGLYQGAHFHEIDSFWLSHDPLTRCRRFG